MQGDYRQSTRKTRQEAEKINPVSMDLNDYFDPVSLERPRFHFVPEEHSFSRNISIHTPDRPIRDLDRHQLALVGIPQDGNALIKGSAEAPDRVRGMLYQLRMINDNIQVYDLGNLKITERVSDTYYALRDITLELMERDIVPLFIGGSQDLSFGAFLALEKRTGTHQVLTVDPRFDFAVKPEQEIHSRNYLDYIMDPEKTGHFIPCHIGHQVYFVTGQQLDRIENEHQVATRLGEIRHQLKMAEPIIRDSAFISMDINAVRHSDAPGTTIPSPNGFFGDEWCMLTRYAGLSHTLKALGIFELNPSNDLNDQTSHLAAQAIWYFIDGLSRRIKEHPLETPEHTRKFIISMNESEEKLVFHKSTLSEKWWMELPAKNPATNHNFFISCSYEDYQRACNQEIPDRWWKYLRRLAR